MRSLTKQSRINLILVAVLVLVDLLVRTPAVETWWQNAPRGQTLIASVVMALVVYFAAGPVVKRLQRSRWGRLLLFICTGSGLAYMIVCR